MREEGDYDPSWNDKEAVKAHQWKKGNVVNPGGRLKQHRITWYMNRLLKTPTGRIDPQTGNLEVDPETGEPIVAAQEVAEAFMSVARDPNHPAWPFAMSELLRRTEGRVPKIVEGEVVHRRIIEIVRGPATSKEAVLKLQGRLPESNGNGNGAHD